MLVPFKHRVSANPTSSPSLATLSVNHNVADDAAITLFEKNVWHLHRPKKYDEKADDFRDLSTKPKGQIEQGLAMSFWQRYVRHVKHIAMLLTVAELKAYHVAEKRIPHVIGGNANTSSLWECESVVLKAIAANPLRSLTANVEACEDTSLNFQVKIHGGQHWRV